MIRQRPAQIADHRDAKNSVAKRGRRAREFLFLEYGRPRRLAKCRFSHTLTRKTRFCTRYRLRTEKIRFLHTFSVTDGKKFTASRRHVQGIKTVCFPNYGRNKKPFFAYVIGYGGKKVHARILFFGRSTLSAGVRPLSSPIGPRQICDRKRRRSNAIFFPAVLACTFSSSAVEIRKGRIPI